MSRARKAFKFVIRVILTPPLVVVATVIAIFYTIFGSIFIFSQSIRYLALITLAAIRSSMTNKDSTEILLDAFFDLLSKFFGFYSQLPSIVTAVWIHTEHSPSNLGSILKYQWEILTHNWLYTILIFLTILLSVGFSLSYLGKNAFGFFKDNMINSSHQTLMWNGAIVTQPMFDSLMQLSINSSNVGVTSCETNVLYIGVQNIITVSGINVPLDNLELSITNGTIFRSSEHYIATVPGGTETYITVSSMKNGVNTILGYYKFLVKPVPDPVCYVNQIHDSGTMSRSEISNIAGIFAKMEDFNYDVSFHVKSFSMTTNVNGVFVELKSNGPGVTPQMQNILLNTKQGNRVIFSDVVVQGPDSALRKIPGVYIKVK